MAILEATYAEIQGGFEKKIEDAAMGMILDMVQRSQYQYPLKSSIREITSNALDSIRERDAAKAILKGKAKVADFYEEREGDLYKDSKFDPDYYDLNWLSDDTNVYISYVIGSMSEKDKLIIEDNGVGLGLYRLEKYFSIGYSTKRLMKLPLGKFGIGNKAPLSMNPFYTMESRYNGRLFRFNIYSGKIESIIPKFDLELNVENELYTLPNGYQLYCEKTTKKNGVRIIIDSKKHYKDQIHDAVQGQLLYFDNVKFSIVEDEQVKEIPFAAKVLYEDDFIIVSDSNYYSKPHMLVNKVNYGYIDFNELELEEKFGSIAIKVKPEEVEVHPSRERLIWNDVTKDTILARFKEVVNIATGLIQLELKETDFLRWIRLCNAITNDINSDASNHAVVGKLAKIVDLRNVKPKFSNTDIKFTPKLSDYLQIYRVEIHDKMKANKTRRVLERTKTTLTSFFNKNLPVVLCTERSNNRKEKYLCHLYPGGFVRIKPPLWLTEEAKELSSVELAAKIYPDAVYPENLMENLKEERQLAETVWNLLNSSIDVLFYKDIDVPDDFVASNDLEETPAEDISLTLDEQKASQISSEARRKLEGKTILQTPRWMVPRHGMEFMSSVLEWQKVEVPVKEINNWSAEEIYWGNDADKESLMFVTMLTRNTTNEDPLHCRKQSGYKDTQQLGNNKNGAYAPYSENPSVSGREAYRCTHFFETDKIMILKVSQSNSKYYQDFYHIKKFFYRISNGKLTMSNTLIQWHTARKIKEKLHKLNFLWNYPFDPERQEKFRTLVKYVRDHYREMSVFSKQGVGEELMENLTGHLEKVEQFQMFVRTCQDPNEIANLAKEMWKTDKITDAYALDTEIWDVLTELLDWAEPIGAMLNEMPILTGIRTVGLGTTNQYQSREDFTMPTDEFEHALLNYVRSKNVFLQQ